MTRAALEGIRVLDLSRVLAGPWATQVLGDLGAEVIKVEKPGAGDDTRSWGPPFAAGLQDTAAYFMAANRNKRAVMIDMADPEGAGLIRSMVAQCDVLVENYKVGTLARYGLDYESLSAINPALIYCSVTGFGQTGPYASRGGYDFLVQGMGGLMSVTGPAGGEPVKVGVPVIDLFTGLYAVIAIQAALHHRERTGEGQYIDCALLDTSVAILSNQAMNYLSGGPVPRPMGNAHPNVVPYRTFESRDGHIIVAVGNDSQFRALCRLLNLESLASDPDYASSAARSANRARLEPVLEVAISQRSSADLIAAMEAAGVPGGPINRLPEVFADPQVTAREMVESHQAEDGSAVSLVRFPAQLSRSPARIRSLPRNRGADTDKVLQDFGYSQEIRDELRRRGTIA